MPDEIATLVKPEPKKAEDSLGDYCRYFDRIVKANSWRDDQAGRIFQGMLEVGSTVLDDLEPAVLEKFSTIKAALAPEKETFREASVQKFFSMELAQGERIEEYLKRCKTAVTECFPGFAHKNKTQLVRDRFVHGLTQMMKDAVLNRKCEKLEDAVQAALMAEDVNSLKAEKSKKFANKSVTNNGKKPGKQAAKAIQCYNCQGFGHISSGCPTRKEDSAKSKNGGGKPTVGELAIQADHRPRLDGAVSGCKARFIVDTGAEVSVLPRSKFTPERDTNRKLRTASSESLGVSGLLSGVVSLGNFRAEHEFFVGEVQEPVLGMDFLKPHGVVIDTSSGELKIGKEVIGAPSSEGSIEAVAEDWLVPLEEGTLLCEIESEGLEENEVALLMNSPTESVEMVTADDLISRNEQESERALEKLQTAELLELKQRWSSVFSGLGDTRVVEHRILTKDRGPVCSPSHRLPIHLMEKARKQVQKMKELGVVRRSQSDWCSPVVLVVKKDGDVRVAIDFRKVNALTKKDAYPMPRVDECLEQVRGAKVFSVLDANQGYYQVRLAEEDIPKTAFRFDGELLEFTRMPFGLCSAGATYGRLMRKILANIPHVVHYLDECVIYSKTVEEHVEDLDRVLAAFHKAKLTIGEAKSSFFKEKISFLGFEVSGDEVRPDEKKLEALKSFPRPSNNKGLTRFLGMASYYRSCIPDFGMTAGPLYALGKKNKRWLWGKDEENAFQNLKKALWSDVKRNIPDPDLTFIVKTDASLEGIGCLLLQEKEGQRRIVECASKRFSETEKRYPVIEQEAAGIMFAIDRWRHFLLGKKFQIETDHRPLQWIQSKKDLRGKLGRWALRLAEYDFDCIHVAAKLNQDADALSRATVGSIGLTRKDLEAAQGNDKGLEEARKKNPDKFQVRNGILFRNDDQRLRVCIPRSQREAVWKDLHEELGHLGQQRMIHLCRDRVFWPKMRDDIKRWTARCITCAMKKDLVPVPRPAPMIAHEDHTLRVLEKWSIDVMGPLPESSKGNKYLFVLLDQFSKWVEAKPVPRIGADPLIQWISETCSRLGLPREIVMDRGPDMESAAMKEYCDSIGVKRTFISPFHHQSNPVERTNRTLLNMIRTYVNQDMKDWDLHLDKVLFAYRAATHESTKTSPFEALYGVPPRLPIDLKFGSSLTEPSGQQELLERMTRVRKDMRVNLEHAAKRRTEKYNSTKKVEEPAFKEKELVYMRRHNIGKLAPLWTGPFRLKNQVSPVDWVIAGRDGKTKIVHSNLLKRAATQSNQDLEILRGRGRPRKDASAKEGGDSS